MKQSATQRAGAKWLGAGCLTLILLLWSVSWWLRCPVAAARLIAFSAGEGAGFALLLAAVTRTRRIGLIYLYLTLAAFALVPIFLLWPFADLNEIYLSPSTPALFDSYFDVARYAAFVLAIPYPFARWGQHGPDTPTAPRTGLPDVSAGETHGLEANDSTRT